jgi:hypothetical protein
MPIHVTSDRYQQCVSKSGKKYWRFNIYAKEGELGFLSLGWSLQENERLHPPFEVIDGRFFTMFRASRPLAQAIYAEAIVRVGELEGREIQPGEGWKTAIYGESSFEKTMPEYYRTEFHEPRAAKEREREEKKAAKRAVAGVRQLAMPERVVVLASDQPVKKEPRSIEECQRIQRELRGDTPPIPEWLGRSRSDERPN